MSIITAGWHIVFTMQRHSGTLQTVRGLTVSCTDACTSRCLIADWHSLYEIQTSQFELSECRRVYFVLFRCIPFHDILLRAGRVHLSFTTKVNDIKWSYSKRVNNVINQFKAGKLFPSFSV